MREKPNRSALLQIMLLRGLDRADIAELVNRKHGTVDQWISWSGKDMPDTVLQLLKYKLGEER